jgi:hypothetical protein
LRFAERWFRSVQRLEEPSTRAAEEVMGATAAAIANPFFDANAHNGFAAESFLDEIAKDPVST